MQFLGTLETVYLDDRTGQKEITMMDLRCKLYRGMDRKALADIAEFCKQDFDVNIFKKSFAKDVTVLDYYSKELSSEELDALDLRYNELFDAELYLVYSNASGKPRICCRADQLWEFTSDGKNANIWFSHAVLGTIAWNCRTGCALVRPATEANLNEWE